MQEALEHFFAGFSLFFDFFEIFKQKSRARDKEQDSSAFFRLFGVRLILCCRFLPRFLKRISPYTGFLYALPTDIAPDRPVRHTEYLFKILRGIGYAFETNRIVLLRLPTVCDLYEFIKRQLDLLAK